MKKLIFGLLLFCFSTCQLSGEMVSAFNFIPDETFGFISVDAQLIVYDFYQFYNKEDGGATRLDRVIGKFARVIGKPEPPKGFFDGLAENLIALQDRRLGHFVEKCHFFLLPDVVKNPSSQDNFLIVLEGEFNLERLGNFAAKMKPENIVQIAKVKNLIMLRAVNKSGGPMTVAVQFGKTLLIGSQTIIGRVLEDGPQQPFFERKAFDNKAVRKFLQKEPYLLFYGRGFKDSKFKWAVGGLNKKFLDIRVRVNDQKQVTDYVKQMQLVKKNVLKSVDTMKSYKGVSQTEVSKDGFARSHELVGSFKIKDGKNGKVYMQVKNPGMGGVSKMLAGFADFMLSGMKKSQKKKK
ncbi:hypothetical protein ACFL35_05620 [Candidatus Riflebacteria bacterium]